MRFVYACKGTAFFLSPQIKKKFVEENVSEIMHTDCIKSVYNA